MVAPQVPDVTEQGPGEIPHTINLATDNREADPEKALDLAETTPVTPEYKSHPTHQVAYTGQRSSDSEIYVHSLIPIFPKLDLNAETDYNNALHVAEVPVDKQVLYVELEIQLAEGKDRKTSNDISQVHQIYETNPETEQGVLKQLLNQEI